MGVPVRRSVVSGGICAHALGGSAKTAEGSTGFAKLVGKRVPLATYFVACYVGGSMPFSPENGKLDEWPGAMLDDDYSTRTLYHFTMH